MAQPDENPREKIIVVNRKARFDYHLEDRIEAGVALVGTEVKSLRQGRVNVTDSYVRIDDGQAFVYKLHISPYEFGTHGNHEPERPRRLLLHKREIARLRRQVEQKSFTLVPTRLYFKNGRVKIEVSLARGKAQHDKRRQIDDRDADRKLRDALRGSRDDR